MADTLRSLREATIAMQSIRERLTMLTWIVSGGFAVGVGMAGGLLYQSHETNKRLTEVAVAVGRLEGKLEQAVARPRSSRDWAAPDSAGSAGPTPPAEAN
jgi:hypothetical protein